MAGHVGFGPFEFDPQRRELRKHGLRVRVPEQSLEILAALVERPGETVTRERIQQLLWPHGTVVGFEGSINAAVRRLREALGDVARGARFVERVPRQGYRFIAPVQPLRREDPGAPDEVQPGGLLLHYRLAGIAGRGSMGEVWKAEDTKLGRTVALKFVPGRLAADAAALEAFQQEARHAAALNHPNICTIHGLEEQDGRRFLVMEYIDGRPLSAALERGPLSAQRVVDVGIQAAQALAAAHGAGVVHRDVKPTNLMLAAGGRVKLTDFGISRAVRDLALPRGAGRHTPTGTPGYMSPEQARGEPGDTRSDVFSLGVVLYEVATGRLPFRGDSPRAAVRAVVEQDPVPPRAVNPELPRELERVILRALAKDVAARWQSALEMCEALQRVGRALEARPRARVWRAAVAAALAATAVGAWLWLRPAPPLAERDAIVIADFENRTGEEVFDGALRQALLSQMGQSPYLRIVSDERIRAALSLMKRPSSDHLTRTLAREVCQRVGGEAVLTGSIGIVGSRYFVGLEAIDCAAGETLANGYAEAESRERVLTALSRAVSTMRRRLGESLASIRKLSVLAEATTPSLEALRAYSIALGERAKGLDPTPFLERAIRLDPDFAAAHFALARVHMGRGHGAEAEQAISRAYALRARSSERERLSIEGLYHQIATGDAHQAIAVGALAAQLYPQDSSSWRWSMLAHYKVGEYDKAFAVARREIEVAPDDGASYVDLPMLLLTYGKTREARAVLDQAIARGLSAEMFPFIRFVAAVLEGDSAAMQREAEAARGSVFEHRILLLQAQAAAFYGQLGKAREIARSAAAREMSSTAGIAAAVALTEAVFGLERDARNRAGSAIRLDHGRRTVASSALALALTNETATAEAALNDLIGRYPNDTLLRGAWSPAVHAAIALAHGDARGAVAATEVPPHAARYAWLSYVRGCAYLRLGLTTRAAVEFRGIIERKAGLFTGTFEHGAASAYPAAQLGLARALAMEGRVEASRQAYEELLKGWSQADPDIPILQQARREHAALPRR